MLAIVTLPSGATLQRTAQVMDDVRTTLEKSAIGKDIDSVFSPEGFSFVGQSENVGMAFIKLTDWSKRSQTAMKLIPQANKILKAVTGAQIFVVNLPTIRGLSQFGGVDMYLQPPAPANLVRNSPRRKRPFSTTPPRVPCSPVPAPTRCRKRRSYSSRWIGCRRNPWDCR